MDAQLYNRASRSSHAVLRRSSYRLCVVMWEQALTAATKLQERWMGPQQAPGRLSPPNVSLALLLYALAGERSCEPAAVSAGWLRYRCGDPRACLTWLRAQLQRMGHQVGPPVSVKEERFRSQNQASRHGLAPDCGGPRLDDAPSQPATAERLRNDPVAFAWWRTSMFTPSSDWLDEPSQSDTETCQLVSALPRFVDHLDLELLADHGGRLAGERVSLLTIAPFTLPRDTDRNVHGVHPHRAVVQGPWWEMDHAGHTVAPGPPAGYHVTYRSLATGDPVTSAKDLVAASDLDTDTAAWETVVDEVVAVPDALIAIPASQDGDLESHAKDSLEAELQNLAEQQTMLIDLPNSPAGLTNPAAKYRAAALDTLWVLRDRELRLVGDSTPLRVAERIVNDPTYPRPNHPPLLADLITEELVAKTNRAHGLGPRPLAPCAPRDRHLVTGRRREFLQQWLREVSGSLITERSSQALDGFNESTTITYARALLVAEGFVQIADCAATPVQRSPLPASPRAAMATWRRWPLAAPTPSMSGQARLTWSTPTLSTDTLRQCTPLPSATTSPAWSRSGCGSRSCHWTTPCSTP